MPSLSRKKVTVEILNDNHIDRQIEGFLVTRTIVSGIVGVATALVFWALGLWSARDLGSRRRGS